jgi:hypothetical protein
MLLFISCSPVSLAPVGWELFSIIRPNCASHSSDQNDWWGCRRNSNTSRRERPFFLELRERTRNRMTSWLIFVRASVNEKILDGFMSRRFRAEHSAGRHRSDWGIFRQIFKRNRREARNDNSRDRCLPFECFPELQGTRRFYLERCFGSQSAAQL